jgi:hypothetical protein
MSSCGILRIVRASGGFSAVETAAIVTALSLLTAIAAPAVDEYVSLAQLTRAMGDERVIASGIMRLSWDIGLAERRTKGWDTTVLAGAGSAPQLGDDGDARWVRAPEGALLTAHLVTNDVSYAVRPLTQSGGRGWRGPYVDGAIDADPWNHRYAVNIGAMVMTTAADTVVISAGPNGLIETPFDRDGLRAGGDDVVALVWSGG